MCHLVCIVLNVSNECIISFVVGNVRGASKDIRVKVECFYNGILQHFFKVNNNTTMRMLLLNGHPKLL